MKRGAKLTAAAVRTDNGHLYTGRRHADCIRLAIEAGEESPITSELQGFMTSDGDFVTRFQAAVIAYRSGQMDRVKRPLLSEDLW